MFSIYRLTKANPLSSNVRLDHAQQHVEHVVIHLQETTMVFTRVYVLPSQIWLRMLCGFIGTSNTISPTHCVLFSIFFGMWQLLKQLPLGVQSPMPHKLSLCHHYPWQYNLLITIVFTTDKHCWGSQWNSTTQGISAVTSLHELNINDVQSTQWSKNVPAHVPDHISGHDNVKAP